MSTKKETPVIDATISAEVVKPVETVNPTKVSVFIPLKEESDTGVAIDQNDYVTVNGKTTKIPRGEYVEVTVPVFLQLRNRYPNL